MSPVLRVALVVAAAGGLGVVGCGAVDADGTGLPSGMAGSSPSSGGQGQGVNDGAGGASGGGKPVSSGGADVGDGGAGDGVDDDVCDLDVCPDAPCTKTWTNMCGSVQFGILDCGSGDEMRRAYLFADDVAFFCDGSGTEFDCVDAAFSAGERCVDLSSTPSGGGGSGGTSGAGGSGGVGGSGGGGSCTTQWCRDADGDGYYNPSDCMVSCAASNPGYIRADFSLGKDCYDSNPAARPSQTEFFETHRGDGSFDYDCDGDERQEYDLKSCAQIGEDDREGWDHLIPPCGTEAPFRKVAYDGWCASSTVQSVARCR